MSKKTHYVLVKVTAPEDMPAAQVRREIRDYVNYPSNHAEIRVTKVTPVPAGWVGDGKTK